MTSLEEAIQITQQTLEPIISKPKCTNKLLSKPPFRFLHDIITSILTVTGFPQKYFTPQELDSSWHNEKSSKLAFIDKLIRIVSIGRGEMLPTNATKVVAGAEPLLTNLLLTEFGKLALDNTVDRNVIVSLSLENGDLETILKREQKVSHPLKNGDQNIIFVARKIGDCDGDLENTKSMISSIISKPKCTEKLLVKPPFRFIYDIIMSVNQKTGLRLDHTILK